VRILAVDYGSARTGLAVCDETETIASPLEVVSRVGTAAGMETLLAIVARERPGLIVVGLPRTPSGALGSQAQAATAFAGRLRARVDVPVQMEDERFTTTIAKEVAGRSSLDARSAAVLLQGLLQQRAGRC
jgi:putative holliday junction resolvase